MNTYINKELYDGKLCLSDGLCHDENDEKNYEYEMITGNIIPVFLSCRKTYEDNKEEYVYNVASMISLLELSKLKSFTHLELDLLIESIIICQREIRSLLLSPEGLILDPEYVFYDRMEKKIKFCFFPWNNMDTFSSYTKMAEFLLSAIDYSDESAVDIAYDIYASVLNKDYDFKKYVIENETDDDVDENDKDEYKSTIEGTKELMTEEMQITSYEKSGARFRGISLVSMTAFVLLCMLICVVFLWSRRLFFYLLGDMKVVSAIVLIFSILVYFPVMDIVSKS